MKTTEFFSPVFLRLSESGGKTTYTEQPFNPYETEELFERWNGRFSEKLKSMLSEIHGAKFSYNRFGDGITQSDRRFLCAVIEHEDLLSESLVTGALRKLYTEEISEEFSKEDIFCGSTRINVLLWDNEKSFILTREKLLEKFDFRYKLTCMDCKYMQKIADTDETGTALCTFQPSYEPIALDARCRFLPETSELRCGDCDRLGKDFGCFACSEEDSASPDGQLCSGFTDKRKNEVMNALYFWKLHNMYSREMVMEILDEFEQNFKTPLD